ncbi:MAG: glycoside-pentoside-hexuronide (GPH):cation symporter [Bifidobacteriaceae bacterium]|jgi:melibiose permease/lactose/raffinose/galactose permease|nr:glycoside-pentoside-hexuronide (GPH):cation symporter [Bifidobacteriaceae bacterium]
MSSVLTRNKYFFGLGTIGRDMFYTMESMFLVFYLTDILNLDDATMYLATIVLTVLRIFDAFNDPIVGMLVDNTRTRWGKFKPPMLIGAIIGGLLLILMFSDFGLKGVPYVVVLGIIYLGWDIFYGVNDISYWSMLPSLTTDQKQREKIGAFARICANVGLFAVVVAIMPVTEMLTNALGNAQTAWLVFSIIVVALMLGFLCFTLFGVRESRNVFKVEQPTKLREMFQVLVRNDQLMWVALAMAIFMIGYTTTTGFGTYFFKYAYGDENQYSVFALVLGVSQIAAMLVFPLLRKKFSRRGLYTLATVLVLLGYSFFFFAPMDMLMLAPCAILIFVGEAFIQILMLMFLADSIEYGQWKLGKRNESITFSVQPFVNKIGAAISNGIVGITVVMVGINSANSAADVTAEGILGMKAMMMLVPMALIIVGYFIYRFKFKIDDKLFAEILSDLKTRGDIRS